MLPNFNSNNFYRAAGLAPTATASGSFGVEEESGNIEVPVTNRVLPMAGAACVSLDYAGAAVWLSIRGIDAAGLPILGRNSNQTDRQIDGTGNAIVGLSAVGDWPWGDYPPYPVEVTTVALTFGPAGLGRGAYYMEFYVYDPAALPEPPPRPPPPPLAPCPERPPWPYQDPGMSASPQGAGRIRRSRP